MRKIPDNRTFWKETKHISTIKEIRLMSNKIILFEKDKIIDKNVAEIMNNYFINITKTLTIKSIKNSNINDIMESLSQFND